MGITLKADETIKGDNVPFYCFKKTYLTLLS